MHLGRPPEAHQGTTPRPPPRPGARRRKGWLRSWRPGSPPAGAGRRTVATRARKRGRGLQRQGAQGRRGRQLHDSIELFTHKSVTGRNAQSGRPPRAPELREQAYRAKEETMANLDRYLWQMADAVEERAATCSSPTDGEDVVGYIGDLARSQGAQVSPSPRAWRPRRSSSTAVWKKTTPTSG